MTQENWDDQPESFETARPAVIIPEREAVTDPERYVLGCCILDEGHTLDKAIEAGLTSPDFYQLNYQIIYSALFSLKQKSLPISLESLIPELGPDKVSQVGGIMSLMNLADPISIPSTTFAGPRIKQILKDSARRRRLNEAQKIVEQGGGEIGDDEVEVKIKDLESRRVKIALAPPEPVTRLFLAGKPIATPGNLVTLISRAKTGKTATIGAVVAAIIAAHHDRSTGIDTFGFTSPHTKEAVILIDTEQSPYDAFTCHQRALSRANEVNDPDWLCHYALVGETAEQLCKDLLEIVIKAKKDHSGVFTIILDGVADFVNSVNDEAECNNFIAWLRSIAVDYDCPIICVIHSNEATKSGDDGRGHLGKQLTRKAESNLLLKKDGEVTTITSEKQRKAPITVDDNVAFRWSDQLGRHVSCGAETYEGKPQKKGRKSTYELGQFIDFFPRSHEKYVPLPILWKKCTSIAEVPRQSFRDMCERFYQNGELERMIDKNVGPCYRLKVVPGE